MTLIRYNVPEIDTLQRQLNRLFDDFMIPSLPETRLTYPAAELLDTNEAIHVKVEIPGMKAEDLDIQVSKDSVSISGERKSETQTEENGVARSEFRYGKFQRVIPLPTLVENTQVTAEYKDGILTLILPKAEEEKNKVFKVKVN
jgi:HSP20 family protein